MVPYLAKLQLDEPEGTGLGFQASLGEKKMRIDSSGDPTLPSPVDALLVAVGGCAGMDVIGVLRKMRQKVTGYDVEVHAERRDEHPRIFTKIEVVHKVRGHDIRPSAVERAIQLSNTKYCSVHAMLHDTVPISCRYEIIPADESETVV